MIGADQERALMLTILKTPAEEGPWKVFADWLEEGGRCEESEFIKSYLIVRRAFMESGWKDGTFSHHLKQYINGYEPCLWQFQLQFRELIRKTHKGDWENGELVGLPQGGPGFAPSCVFLSIVDGAEYRNLSNQVCAEWIRIPFEYPRKCF